VKNLITVPQNGAVFLFCIFAGINSMLTINWITKPFEALTPHELYAIIELRNAVFVVEQSCVFQDADNKDQQSHHFMGWSNGVLAAYVRLLPPGLAYEEASIGRVATAPAFRAQKAGRQLMTEAIRVCGELFGNVPIRIGAQLYLKKFYESLGFIQQGDLYLEDGIEHIIMLRPVAV
jgi:ElaA protein